MQCLIGEPLVKAPQKVEQAQGSELSVTAAARLLSEQIEHGFDALAARLNSAAGSVGHGAPA